MGATFGRLKNWIAEVLSYADLNAEIDNILTNLTPAGVDDYSINTAQMQTQTNPLVSGSPSLANSLAGEIARLRFQIQAIIGSDTTYWYEAPLTTLSELNTIVLGSTVPATRIESIGYDTYTNRLVPDGTLASVTLQASVANPIVYHINNVRYTLTSNALLTGLSSPAATTNTGLVSETLEIANHHSSYLGEHGTTLLLKTTGANFNLQAGIKQGYKVVSGANTEYFIGELLNDATDAYMIQKASRGIFFNSAGTSVPRITVTTNDTVTLGSLAWIFLQNDNTLTLTYNVPIHGFTQPTSPTIGDFWFDFSTTTWKTFGSLGWVESNAVFIGNSIVIGTACVAARSVEPYAIYSAINQVELEAPGASSASIQIKHINSKISVYNNNITFGVSNNAWSALNLESGSSLSNSTTYYCYIKETGALCLSVIAPRNRTADLYGFYHPAHSWRCVGYGTTNGSALFLDSTIVSFNRTKDLSFFSNDIDPVGKMGEQAYDSTASPSTLFNGWLRAEATTFSRGFYRQLRNGGIPTSFCGTGDNLTTFVMPLMAETGWVTFTPTGSWTANTTYTGAWRKNGANFEIHYNLITSAAPTATTLTLNLPSGFGWDASVAMTPGGAGTGMFLASGYINDNGGTSYQVGVRCNASNAVINPIYFNAGAIAAITQAAPFTWGASDSLWVMVSIPALLTSWKSTSASIAATNAYKQTIIKVLK